jgi:penicillin-binding protein 1C
VTQKKHPLRKISTERNIRFAKIVEIISRIKQKHFVAFCFLISFFSILVLLFSFYLYIAYLLPLPITEETFLNTPTTKIFDRNGKLLYEILKPEKGRTTYLSFDQIPQEFIQATLAAEDNEFYHHQGVDFFASGRALISNISEGRIVSGGSTITQQLVRNLLGTQQQRDISTKILESFYAIRLSHLYSKDQILEQYINKVYYGNLSYGAQSASLNYFGKNLQDLDLAETSFIVGLPQSPSSYNPYNAFSKAKTRQGYVLKQLLDNQYITQEQYNSALSEPINLRTKKNSIQAPHFIHEVIAELEDEYGEDMVNRGGLQVTTTLDLNLQLMAEKTVNDQVNFLHRHNVSNGALLSVDVKTGQILAWVGSNNYFDDSIDGAVDMITSLRQPGSSIKPLTYLLAFEKGYTPATVLFDVPTQFSTATGPYSPKNYDLDYHGPVRIRTALASSYNIPAVKTLDYVGVENFISFLRKLGIDTLNQSSDHYGLALTLGGGEVRPYDMAKAFLTLANYGYKKPLTDILRITDASNKDIYSWQPPSENFVLSVNGKQHAYQIIDILKDPNARIPGFGEDSVLDLTHEAAVKTGTTRNFRDNWTIGFTPDLLTVVWVGNADASPMENISGVDGAAPIWANFMEQALAGKPFLHFYIPDRLKQIEVCSLSGLLTTDLCQENIIEWFVQGSEPKEYDNYYQKLLFNSITGHAIYPECVNRYNKAMVKEKSFITYPQELQKWAAQKGYPVAVYESCSAHSVYSSTSTVEYPDVQSNTVLFDTPRQNDEYLLDNTLPLNSQKVPFRITVPLETVQVTYFVDNQQVSKVSDLPFTYLWLATKGIHKLKAVAELSDGSTSESREIQFFVK